MPEEFSDYLLSSEVGFAECLPLGTPENPSKGLCKIIIVATTIIGYKFANVQLLQWCLPCFGSS